MALKDWKKSLYGWSHKTKNDELYIEKYDKEYLISLFKDEQLQNGKSRKGEFEKLFKTKSQALKYAKAYMRKH